MTGNRTEAASQTEHDYSKYLMSFVSHTAPLKSVYCSPSLWSLSFRVLEQIYAHTSPPVYVRFSVHLFVLELTILIIPK